MVCIALASLLLALIVPAIQNARDTSRRTECINRLRQLGIAVQQFETNHRTLPPTFNCNYRRGNHSGIVSAQFLLLPFLDQAPAYQEILEAKRMAITDQKRRFSFPVFRCPAERNSFGIGYRTCTGRIASISDDPPSGEDSSRGFGAFPLRCGGLPLSAIRDGLSNTVAMSERSVGDGFKGQFSNNRDIWFNAAMLLGFDPKNASEDEFAATCDLARVSGPGNQYTPYSGHDFLESGYIHTMYNHLLPPNSQTPDCVLATYQIDDPATATNITVSWGAVGARSEHRDRTVSTLLLDGSVRLIAPSVDVEIWRSAASRADSDAVW